MIKQQCDSCGAPLQPSQTLLRCPYCSTLYSTSQKREMSRYNIRIGTDGGVIQNSGIVIGSNIVVGNDFVGRDKITIRR